MVNYGMSNLRKKLFIALFCSPLFLSSPANAGDLGMTPNHVFGLWTSINDVLLKLAAISSDEKTLTSRMAAMDIERVDGKKPADVLEQVRNFRETADLLLSRSAIPAIVEDKRISSDTITPSDVFLSSGHVLDGTVLLLASKTEADTLISPYYKPYNFSGKTPSDVYALVYLANQRLALLK